MLSVSWRYGRQIQEENKMSKKKLKGKWNRFRGSTTIAIVSAVYPLSSRFRPKYLFVFPYVKEKKQWKMRLCKIGPEDKKNCLVHLVKINDLMKRDNYPNACVLVDREGVVVEPSATPDSESRYYRWYLIDALKKCTKKKGSPVKGSYTIPLEAFLENVSRYANGKSAVSEKIYAMKDIESGSLTWVWGGDYAVLLELPDNSIIMINP